MAGAELARGKSDGARGGVQAALRSGGRLRKLHRRLAPGKMANSSEALFRTSGWPENLVEVSVSSLSSLLPLSLLASVGWRAEVW